MKKVSTIVLVVLTVIAFFLVTGCMQNKIPPDVQQNIDKYVGFWNTGQFEGIENVLDSNYELRESTSFEPLKGIEAFKKAITELRTAYPDFKVEINETVYEPGKLGLIWTVTGTNTGPGQHPPTGKAIKGQGISFVHFNNGKVKDEWIANNDLLWMQQLGYTFLPPAVDTIQKAK